MKEWLGLVEPLCDFNCFLSDIATGLLMLLRPPATAENGAMWKVRKFRLALTEPIQRGLDGEIPVKRSEIAASPSLRSEVICGWSLETKSL